jgi:hypothetical protein
LKIKILIGHQHSFYYFCEIFATCLNIHHIPIVDDFNNYINLITQEQIIDFFFKNAKELGDVTILILIIGIKETCFSISKFNEICFSN